MSRTTPARIHDAKVIRVKDGDTMVMEVDLDFRVFARLDVRLQGIDCPELPTPAGLAAKKFTEDWVAEHPAVILRSYKDPDLYSRWLGVIWATVETASLNAALVDVGLAIPKSYR